jgi:hypothetical protein
MRYVELVRRADLLADRLRSAAICKATALTKEERSGLFGIKLATEVRDNFCAWHEQAKADARAATNTPQFPAARQALIEAALAFDAAKRDLAVKTAAHHHRTPPIDVAATRRHLAPAINEAAQELVTLLSICDRIIDGFDACRVALPPGVPAGGLTAAVLVRSHIKHARATARDLASPVPK